MADFLLTPPSKAPRPGCNFLAPPIDGSLTVPEMYDWHLEKNPNHPVFAFANASGVHEFTMAKVVPAAHKAARFIARAADIDLVGKSNPLVAIIPSTDHITQFTIILGLLRAGIPCFPINHLLSDAYIEHLIISCQPPIIFISHEARIEHAIQSAVEKIKLSDKSYHPKIFKVPTYHDIYNDENSDPLPTREYDPSSPTIITCSSGSTSLPKPIVWNSRSNLQAAISPLFSKIDFCGKRFSPYGSGVNGIMINYIAWIAATGLVLTTFTPGTLAPFFEDNPEAYFQGFVNCHVSYVFDAAKRFEAWSRDPAKVEFLATREGVISSGTTLNEWTGNYLANKGVKFAVVSGMTEVGVISFIPEPLESHEWEYFTFNTHCAAEVIPQGDGTFELVIVSRPTQEITVSCNTSFQGEQAYASGDLLVRHPEKTNYWKFVGRKSDQVVLSNGTKVLPRSLEDFFLYQPEVKGAMMFGNNKPYVGLLVEFKPTSNIDPNNTEQVNEFIHRIWPTIDGIMKSLPESSRLHQDMIIPASPSKPFEFTGKGNPRRAVLFQLYEKEINALYQNNSQ